MRQCTHCGNGFVVKPEDKEYFERQHFPEPRMCHTCSWKAKMAWENEYKVYQRTCDATGAGIISVFRPDAPFPVYERTHWLGNTWEPPTCVYDPARPFIDQYRELFKKAPRPHNNQVNTVNTEYGHNVFNSADCYLAFQAFECEKLFYTYRAYKLKQSAACFFCSESELLYACANCHKSYNLKFAKDSEQCVDSAFLFDCKNCSDCFMCWNLRNKKYCFKNKQMSAEEYRAAVAAYDITTPAGIHKAVGEFRACESEFIYKMLHTINADGCVGDFLVNCSRCFECYFTDDSTDNTYVMRGTQVKNSYDTVVGGLFEFCYQALQCGWLNGSAFVSFCNYGHDLFFSDYCDHCSECIGCIGLKKKEYCILNKQYTKEEYTVLKKKIFKELDYGGWESFYEVTHSPFTYDETIADLYYPSVTRIQSADPPVLALTDQNALQTLHTCGGCGKQYKIVKQELEFHKKIGVVLPGECFYCRIERMARPYAITALQGTTCVRCGTAGRTGMPTGAGKMYCNACYIHAFV